MKYLFVIILFFSAGLQVWAQDTLTISGRVIDAETGDPLIGSNVLVSGTRMGVITDFNGYFKYLLRSEDIPATILEVTYLGMKPQYIRVGDRRYFDIRMQEDIQQLEEVVITSSYMPVRPGCRASARNRTGTSRRSTTTSCSR